MGGKESAAYADSAYQSEKHDTWLSERGIENRLTKRAYRNRPLTEKDKQFNRLHSGVRSTVERVFGVLKQHYGMAKARYLGLARNRTRFELMCVAHNIKRGLSLQQASCAWNQQVMEKMWMITAKKSKKGTFELKRIQKIEHWTSEICATSPCKGLILSL